MDVFNLVAKIALDTKDYKSGLDDAQDQTSSFASKLSGGLKTVAKVGAAAVGLASGAVVAITKNAVDQYADYEQLVGGVETLFGDSADKVVADAQKAFKTAGMSMNDYMETSIQSAAALINSLDGDQARAADLMNMSIVDMSDNVNKMGTSMEAVQNAYRGFSRGNFTMLDNLALGFAGTKEGMQDLLDKAQALSGVEYDIESYSDIVQAIHVVQEEMGIAGTTATEASETISGSVASMKSAWTNLVTSLGDDNANIEESVDLMVESVLTVGENMIPRVQTILGGLGKLISTASQKLVPVIISTIVDNLPSIIETGINLVVTLASSLISAIPTLVKAIPSLIMAIVNGFVNSWPTIRDAGADLVEIVGEGITSVVNLAKEWGSHLIQNFVDGIKAKFSALKDSVMNVANTVKDFLGFSEPDEGPLSNFHTYAPDMMKLFAKGIRDNESLVTDQLSKSFDFGNIIADTATNSGSTVTGAKSVASQPIQLIVNVVDELDGAVFARKSFRYFVDEGDRRGQPIVVG